jgi:hypothetical protein
MIRNMRGMTVGGGKIGDRVQAGKIQIRKLWSAASGAVSPTVLMAGASPEASWVML